MKRRAIAARQTLTPKRTSEVRKPVRSGPALRLRGTVGAGGSESVAAAPTETAPTEPKPKKPRKTVARHETPVEPKSTADTAATSDTTDKAAQPAVSDTTGGVEPKPAEPPARGGAGKGHVVRRGFFANASSALSSPFKAHLDDTVKWMQRNPDKNITVEGHTSSVGNASLNQELSEKRAEAVKAYLVDQGIDAGRITTRGVGSDKPAFSPGRNPKNRRVEITVDE